MAIARWTAYQAADTAIASTDLNALASGSAAANFRLGAAINNTRSGATQGWLYGDFELILSSAVTAGTGSPFLAIYILPSLDGGTTYPTTNGAATAGPTSLQYLAATVQVPASTAVQTIVARGLILPPQHFRVMINNVLGVATPSTNTSTARLYRYSEEGV